MAHFINYHVGQFWGASLGDPLSGNAQLLYVENDNVGFLCEDGTKVYLFGTGFTYATDAAGVPWLTGGSVTLVEHFTSAGAFISRTSDILGSNGSGAMLNTVISSAVKSDGLRTISVLEVDAFHGNDVIDARTRIGNAAIDDTLNGWNGDDSMFGGRGNDHLSGDAGSDRLFGGGGNDKLAGGWGNDLLSGGYGNDLLSGGSGNDSLVGNRGLDTAFYLGNFADLSISKTAAGFVVQSGENGTDTLTGIERIATNDGVYRFDPSFGNWIRVSNAQQSLMLADTLATENGSAGNDVFQSGVPGPVYSIQQPLDLLFGGAGNDTYSFTASYGGTGPIHSHGLLYAYGGDGDDTFAVQAVQDYLLTPPAGIFRFFGEAGNDILTGGHNNDQLNGGSGNDNLNGGQGDDILTGGAGLDVFTFTNIYASNPRFSTIASGDDIITDFVVGQDKLSFAANVNLSLTDTPDGMAIMAFTPANLSLPPGSDIGVISSVFLQGVHGPLSAVDLLA